MTTSTTLLRPENSPILHDNNCYYNSNIKNRQYEIMTCKNMENNDTTTQNSPHSTIIQQTQKPYLFVYSYKQIIYSIYNG